ncbi:glycosyltransferase [Gelidibacter salicanalis]|uniref:Glycosyltransferase n=1 Tax=Gelidibacter salicanalis TaxID=291193 RepID=A0A934KTI6_9FLAO|nr:glycosyltransferase [Gelidibacter salicanalis]MBJ7879893.1 glycosyltransferase [Gelidibacter salicanalis]
MQLSIIIPVYNVEKHIAQCLDSLLDQGLGPDDYEIILVNDGSTDSSSQIAHRYADQNSNILVIDKENGGVGSARNCGMDSAKGKYIYFIDSDDYLVSHSLRTLIDTCNANDLDILTFLSTSFSTSISKIETLVKSKEFRVSFGDDELSPIVDGEEYLANVNYRGEIWWFVTNREFLVNSNIRFIETGWMEDAIFSLQLILEARRMAHLKLDAHRHRFAPGTAMTSKEPKHYLKVIRDLHNAANVHVPIIAKLESNNANPEAITRIKARQQSFVFFSMLRMIESTMSFDEVKERMNTMTHIKAYPLTSFLGKDYNGIPYQVLSKLLNSKRSFYFFFKLLNPIFKLKNNSSKP